jgi:predicted nucleic acid-binding protein
MPDRLVVSNTSPLLYLHQIRQLELLRSLFGTIVVPRAVADELASGSEHGHDVPELTSCHWLRIQSPPEAQVLPAVIDLGRGEAEVLAFGLAAPDTLLLLDDSLARRIAALNGLSFTGTLGLLVKAKQEGLVARLAPILEQLGRTTIWLSPELVMWALEEAGELE